MKKYIPKVLLTLIVLVPFVYITSLVITKGVNMPYQDDWALVPVFEAFHQHHIIIGLKLLWDQHNEHRVFFPNLVSVIIAYFTRWNLHIEMLLNVLLVLCLFVIFYWYISKSSRTKTGLVATSLITSLLMFSPTQWENWLWGWQIEWYFCIIFGLSALVLLDKRFVKIDKNISYWLAGVLCFIASFSLGNGLFFWLGCLIPLYANKHGRKKILLWITGFLASSALYLYHYAFLPSNHMQLTAVNYIQFFFAYIGAALSQEIGTAVTIGVVLVLFTGGLLYKAVRLDRIPLRSITLPLALIGFVIFSDIITLNSRINIFGINGALASRYISVSTLYFVALLLIIVQLKLQQAVSYYMLAAIVVPFIIGGYINGVDQLDAHSTYFKSVKKCLELPNPPDSCIINSYPDAVHGRAWLNYIKSMNIGGF
jgi:hypothetical protein